MKAVSGPFLGVLESLPTPLGDDLDQPTSRQHQIATVVLFEKPEVLGSARRRLEFFLAPDLHSFDPDRLEQSASLRRRWIVRVHATKIEQMQPALGRWTEIKPWSAG